MVSEGGGPIPQVNAPNTLSSSPLRRELLTIERRNHHDAVARLGLQAQLNLMNSQLQNAQQTLQEAGMENTNLRREKIAVEGDRDRTVEDLKSLRADYDALQAKYDELQADYDDMKIKLHDSNNKLTKCNDENTRQSSTIDRCNAIIDKLQSVLCQMKKSFGITGSASHTTTSNECDHGIQKEPALKKRKISEMEARKFGSNVVKAVVEATNDHMKQRALFGLYGTNVSGHTIDLLSRIFGTETRLEVDKRESVDFRVHKRIRTEKSIDSLKSCVLDVCTANEVQLPKTYDEITSLETSSSITTKNEKSFWNIVVDEWKKKNNHENVRSTDLKFLYMEAMEIEKPPVKNAQELAKSQ